MRFLIHKTAARVFDARLFLVAIALLGTCGICPADTADKETELKVAYVFNFLKLTDWAVALTGKLQVAVWADTDFTAECVKQMAGRSMRGMDIEIRVLRDRADFDQAQGACAAVYIGATEAERAGLKPGALRRPGLLVVGEGEDFCKNGGMIGLATRANRLRFDVNIDAARDSGLTFSSKLLQLAQHIFKGTSS